MGEWTIASTLNCVYFFLLILGAGYAIIAWALGGLAHLDLPGVDIDIPGIDLHPGEPDIHLELPFSHDISHDVDHPEVQLSPLSPIIVATFVMAFGSTGLVINNLTSFSPVLGLFTSGVSGVALSVVMFLLYTRVLMAAQGSSEVQAGELVGQTAEVITPIPAGKVGGVALVARGSRIRSPARSADGQPIPKGAMVEIVEEAGNAIIVQTKREARTNE